MLFAKVLQYLFLSAQCVFLCFAGAGCYTHDGAGACLRLAHVCAHSIACSAALNLREHFRFVVALSVFCHHCEEIFLAEIRQPEHFLRLHSELLRNLVCCLALVEQTFNDCLHRFEQVCSACSVVRDGAEDVSCIVCMLPVGVQTTRATAPRKGERGAKMNLPPTESATSELRPPWVVRFLYCDYITGYTGHAR